MRLAVQTPWVLMMRMAGLEGGLCKLHCRGREKGKFEGFSSELGQYPSHLSHSVERDKMEIRTGLLGALTEWIQSSSTDQLYDVGQVI